MRMAQPSRLLGRRRWRRRRRRRRRLRVYLVILLHATLYRSRTRVDFKCWLLSLCTLVVHVETTLNDGLHRERDDDIITRTHLNRRGHAQKCKKKKARSCHQGKSHVASKDSRRGRLFWPKIGDTINTDHHSGSEWLRPAKNNFATCYFTNFLQAVLQHFCFPTISSYSKFAQLLK